MSREQTTIRLTESLLDEINEEAEERDLNRSEYIRQLLQNRHKADELRDEVDTLREQLASREKRVTELEEQLRKRREIEDKVDEVAMEVKEQRESSNAPFVVKWYKWWKNRNE